MKIPLWAPAMSRQDRSKPDFDDFDLPTPVAVVPSVRGATGLGHDAGATEPSVGTALSTRPGEADGAMGHGKQAWGPWMWTLFFDPAPGWLWGLFALSVVALAGVAWERIELRSMALMLGNENGEIRNRIVELERENQSRQAQIEDRLREEELRKHGERRNATVPEGWRRFQVVPPPVEGR